MTYFKKLKQKLPGVNLRKATKILCPGDLFAEAKHLRYGNPNCQIIFGSCKACWNQEYKGEDEK